MSTCQRGDCHDPAAWEWVDRWRDSRSIFLCDKDHIALLCSEAAWAYKAAWVMTRIDQGIEIEL